jgi:hypothetical protein
MAFSHSSSRRHVDPEHMKKKPAILELEILSEYEERRPGTSLYQLHSVPVGTIELVREQFNIEPHDVYAGLCTDAASTIRFYHDPDDTEDGDTSSMPEAKGTSTPKPSFSGSPAAAPLDTSFTGSPGGVEEPVNTSGVRPRNLTTIRLKDVKVDGGLKRAEDPYAHMKIFNAIYKIRDGAMNVMVSRDTSDVRTDVDRIYVEVNVDKLYRAIKERINIHVVSKALIKKVCGPEWFVKDWQHHLARIKLLDESLVSNIYLTSPSLGNVYEARILVPMPVLGQHYNALQHNGDAHTFIAAMGEYYRRNSQRYTREEEKRLM